jgi:hypothetical protein
MIPQHFTRFSEKTTTNKSQHYAGDDNAHDSEEESYKTSGN